MSKQTDAPCDLCDGKGYVCTRLGTTMDEPEYEPCPNGCPDTRRLPEPSNGDRDYPRTTP